MDNNQENMEIIAKYIREKHKFTKSDLVKLFQKDNEYTSTIINHLKAFRILREINPKKIKYTDDYDPDDDLEEINETYYSFKFVGVISIGNIVLKCYPKYLFKYDVEDESLSQDLESDLREDLKKIFSVIFKYQKSIIKSLPAISEDPSNKPFELLPLMIYLLTDYFENGLYTSSKVILESNGSGEINWDRTINDNVAYISNGRPYYFDLKTRKRLNDDTDFFRLLHQCVLNKCSHDLSKEGIDILDLLNIPEVEFPYQDLSDFGDKDYIIYRLQMELSQVFDSRRQELLKRMIEYISGDFSLSDDCFTFYGTTSFHMVWENVCSEVFNNMLDRPLSELLSFLPDQILTGGFCKNCNKSLMELIGKPIWHLADKPSGISTIVESDKTLKPDIAFLRPPQFFIPPGDTDSSRVPHPPQFTILHNLNTYEFTIFDAKYYCIDIKKNRNTDELRILHQPGIGDITKQYLYQLAYMKFVQSYNRRRIGIMTTKNCFILPMKEIEKISTTDKHDVFYMGKVVLDLLKNLDPENPLDDIHVYQVDADKIYTYYLNEEKCYIADDNTLRNINELIRPSTPPSSQAVKS